jgi:hypothetical protein
MTHDHNPAEISQQFGRFPDFPPEIFSNFRI